MRKRIILFIIPVVALIVMLAIFTVTNLTSSYAAGATHQSKPSHTISAPSHGLKPNFSWGM